MGIDDTTLSTLSPLTPNSSPHASPPATQPDSSLVPPSSPAPTLTPTDGGPAMTEAAMNPLHVTPMTGVTASAHAPDKRKRDDLGHTGLTPDDRNVQPNTDDQVPTGRANQQ